MFSLHWDDVNHHFLLLVIGVTYYLLLDDELDAFSWQGRYYVEDFCVSFDDRSFVR